MIRPQILLPSSNTLFIQYLWLPLLYLSSPDFVPLAAISRHLLNLHTLLHRGLNTPFTSHESAYEEKRDSTEEDGDRDNDDDDFIESGETFSLGWLIDLILSAGKE